MKQIRVITNDGFMFTEAMVEQGNGFCVTRDINLFAINHEKSGICITHVDSVDRGVHAISVLDKMVTPSGVRLADVQACELLALAPWVQAQYAKKNKADAKRIMAKDAAQNAAVIAEIIKCESIDGRVNWNS